MSKVLFAAISAEPIETAELRARVDEPRAGALVSFEGVVRNHDAGNSVLQIDYAAHPDAEQILVSIAAEISERDQVCAVGVVHRTGLVSVGELAMYAMVAAEHRQAAFAAVSDLVDEIKRRLPVWKNQYFDDGSSHWTGLP